MKIGNLAPELKARFDAALVLRDAGSFPEAIAALRELNDEAPDCAAILGTIGAIYLLKIKDSRSALPFLEDATRLAPSSELASAGLFHCLWRLGRRDAAFEEMSRFLATNHSNFYQSLLNDLNGDED